MIRLLFVILAFSQVSEAGIKMRAREHFEWHSYDLSQTRETAKYFGLSNTINLWYEEREKFAVGLAAGPVLGSAKPTGGDGLGDVIRLYSYGVEGKYFVTTWKPIFVRVGLYYNRLEAKQGFGVLDGWSYYSGIGWEIPINNIGIAPEFAIRRVHLNKGVSGTVVTPSIGVHFYSL